MFRLTYGRVKFRYFKRYTIRSIRGGSSGVELGSITYQITICFFKHAAQESLEKTCTEKRFCYTNNVIC